MATAARIGPLDTMTSGLASMARLRYGAAVCESVQLMPLADETSAPPALTLYEFENCPFCRRVREVVTYLDLRVTIVPCARGSRHRAAVVAAGGKAQFPYLVDAAAGVSLYESAAIIEHLLARHGGGAALPSDDFFSPLNTAAAFVPTLLRAGRGGQVSSAAAAAERRGAGVVFFSYENNQFCRLVREVLCELDIPYELRSAGKGSRRRDAMLAATGGSSRCPHLLDPLTGASVTDSAAIIDYLYATFAAADRVA
jgi:anaphase-promoting complex subunit 7